MKISDLIDAALQEDIKDGDVTSLYFVPKSSRSTGRIIARENGVLAGLDVALAVFKKVTPAAKCTPHKEDGDRLKKGDTVIEIAGSTRSMLTAERTALNFLQRMSGVASLTRQFVDLTKGTNARILDTRKTLPGWRELDKAAVAAGGGKNHRMGLYDMAMVKDNHLLAGNHLTPADLQKSIHKLKKERPETKIELEADKLTQVENFLQLEGVDYILLDNMTLARLRKAVAMNKKAGSPVELEASGGVNLDTVANIAKTGVDYISVGALTHSARALDLAFDFD
jgi:nicotinate-nucleotide pyrophosphorylase (carboxylating)